MKIDAYTKTVWHTSKEELQNFDTYFLAINLWLNLCIDLGQPNLADYLKGMMLQQGLLATIRFATKLADTLRKGGPGSCYAVRQLWRNRHVNDPEAEFSDQLQAFDYLRRFSIENPDIINEKSIDDMLEADMTPNPICSFKTGNQIRRMRGVDGFDEKCNHLSSRFLGSFIKWLKRLLPSDCEVNMYRLDHHKHGPGAVSDACTCLACKRMHEAHWYPGSVYTEGTEPLRNYSVTPMGVPKSYKVSRVISPLPTLNQSEAYILAEAMDEHLRSLKIKVGSSTWKADTVVLLAPDNSVDIDKYGGITYHNPSHIAISGEGYATIDSSRASDCVLKAHVAKVGTNFSRKLLENAPSYFIRRDGKKQKMRMFAPMGSATTFPVERVVFAAIVLTAYEYYEVWRLSSDRPLRRPMIFGDDIVCDERVYELVIHLLRIFGFEPNEDKSFGDPNYRYREACGRHFFNGVDVTCLYFPRHPMNGDYTVFDFMDGKWTSRASALLKMNNHLLSLKEDRRLKFGYMLGFIQAYIRQKWPNVTFTRPDAPWASDDVLLGEEVQYPTYDLLSKQKELRSWFEIFDQEGQIAPSLRVGVTCVGQRATKYKPSKFKGHWLSYRPMRVKHCPHERLAVPMSTFTDALLYEEYLLSGPSFNNKLDELLNVSTRRNKSIYTNTPILDFVNKWG
jgi:hypothetical protein